MSRTQRIIISYPSQPHGDRFFDRVDDTAAKHRNSRWQNRKLTPYIKNPTNSGDKWYYGDVNKNKDGFSFRSRTGKGAGQSAKNYNRSFKKGVRQQGKAIIQKELSCGI